MKKALSIFFLIIPFLSHAQTYKFGDVPREHLEMEVYKHDSSANAVVLFSKGESDLTYRNEEFLLIVKRHVRVKVLTDEGLERGDISIRFRNDKSSNPQEVKSIKATSYFLNSNNEVIKDDVGRKDRFEEEVSEYTSEIKFQLPGLRKGSVFEYSYEIISNNPLDFPDWLFQDEIPVVWSEYQARIPEWFDFRTITRGFHNYYVNEQSTYSDYLTFRGSNRGGIDRFEFQGTEYRYVMKNLPGINEEPYMKASLDYLSHIRYKLASIQMPNSILENYLSTWTGIVNEMIDDSDYGGKLGGKWVSSKIEGVVSDADSDMDKLIKVYNHISDHMDWDNQFNLWVSKSLEEIYNDGTGSSSEINMILVDFLRLVGLEAYPVVVSTRENGEIIRLFTGYGQFNHSIVYVEVDGQYYLLDATNDKLPYNLLPPEVLNGEGLLIYPNRELWVPIDNSSVTSQVNAVNIMVRDTLITGTYSSSNKGYYAYNKRNQIDFSDLNTSVFELIGKPENYSIDSVRITNDRLNDSFDFEINFEIGRNMESKVLYINPLMIGGVPDNPFEKEERSFPVDYNFPFSRNLIYSMNIMDGWEVDELPQSVVHRLPDNSGEFRRLIQQNGNSITMNFIFRIKKYRYMSAEYSDLKGMYDQMVDMLQDNIVLIRKSDG